jgi:hypothetical protein
VSRWFLASHFLHGKSDITKISSFLNAFKNAYNACGNESEKTARVYPR